MRIVSIINYKGGVGKTTVTANLAAELAWRGQKVLLLDLDPQASLTFSFMDPETWERELSSSLTIKKWFDSFSRSEKQPLELTSLVTRLPLEGRLEGKGRLDLIPSHLGLINVDLDLATHLGGASLLQNKLNYLNVHRRLLDGLAAIPDGIYDIVLIDCPPNFNVVTKTAIVASEHILIPAKPDYLSTLGVDYLRKSLDNLVLDYNEYAGLDDGETAIKIHPRIIGVVFTMVQEYNGQPIATIRPYMRQTRGLGLPVFDAYIKENKTLFSDAPKEGMPVVLTSPSAQTHKQIVEDLEKFVTEFEAKLDFERGQRPNRRDARP